jgi:hypothetical protein
MRAPALSLRLPLAAHPQAAAFELCGAQDFPEEPLYGVLCRLIARSPGLLALLDAAPATQRRANLILAALHDQVLSDVAAGGPLDGLGAWFASVGGQRSPDDDELPQALTDFAVRHAQPLARLVATRRTQTNEIGRCAGLRLALDEIARSQNTATLALFDFGCSAGLNLLVDRYRIDYLAGHRVTSVGPSEAPPPALSCRLAGAPPQALTAEPGWTLTHRQGTDQAPVDVDDDASVRWLRACLWPSDAARLARLDMALAQTRALRPSVVAADDGLAVLADWLDALPSGVTPVLFNSWVLAYFTPAQLALHRQRVEALVQGRGLVWLSAEDAAVTSATTGLAVPQDPLPDEVRSQAESQTFWTLVAPGADPPAARLLARSHPHGAWLQWLADGQGRPCP